MKVDAIAYSVTNGYRDILCGDPKGRVTLYVRILYGLEMEFPSPCGKIGWQFPHMHIVIHLHKDA